MCSTVLSGARIVATAMKQGPAIHQRGPQMMKGGQGNPLRMALLLGERSP